MFRSIQWYLAKRRFLSPKMREATGCVGVALRGHTARVQDFPPNTKSYERLAPLWDAYASWSVPGYDWFLPSAGQYYRQPIRTVLDLACGTGLLTRRFAAWAESVVGLDASEAMLREARRRTVAGNIRYVQQDFRDFCLDAVFDGVVCGSDSLNYVETYGELVDVFQCVGRHLLPDGLFLFDVLGESAFRALATMKTVVCVNSERFEIYSFYDPTGRECECRAVIGGSVERHLRIPIDESDVERAASKSGLGVIEHFAPKVGIQHFYMLRKTPS